MSGKYDFRQMDAEAWFIQRLGEHGHAVRAGITDPEERRERIRFAILEAKLEVAILGKNSAGKVETYSQGFERFYGESLEGKATKPPRPKRSTVHA